MSFRHALFFTLAILLVQPQVASRQEKSRSDAVTVRFDYSAVELLLDAIDRKSIREADVTTLLRNHGVQAMVDNVTRYMPAYGREQFRSELLGFVQTRQTGGPFGIGRVFQAREQVRLLVANLRSNEPAIISEMLKQLEPYRPRTGPLVATVYFVAGGTSDGFVLDGDDEPAFFVALDKANGDLPGEQLNMTHELYHVMQKAAARSVPSLSSIARDPAQLPLTERLLAATLWEGTANYAADALKATGNGPYIEMWRGRYVRNAEPSRIKENFALFDTTLAELRAGRINWEQTQRVGFSGDNDARLYFVGYEMAKAIDHYAGPRRIGELFEQPPAAFFQEYIALYRQHPDITARFTAATEVYIEGLD